MQVFNKAAIDKELSSFFILKEHTRLSCRVCQSWDKRNTESTTCILIKKTLVHKIGRKYCIIPTSHEDCVALFNLTPWIYE